MLPTSNVDNSSAVLTVRSSVTVATSRSMSVSTRNAGVPVSNQWAANSRRRNSQQLARPRADQSRARCAVLHVWLSYTPFHRFEKWVIDVTLLHAAPPWAARAVYAPWRAPSSLSPEISRKG